MLSGSSAGARVPIGASCSARLCGADIRPQDLQDALPIRGHGADRAGRDQSLAFEAGHSRVSLRAVVANTAAGRDVGMNRWLGYSGT